MVSIHCQKFASWLDIFSRSLFCRYSRWLFWKLHHSSCFSLFRIFIKMSTVPRKNNQQMQRSHQTHKDNRGVNVQARSLEMEVLSSVCLVPFCHVVSNQTTLTAYLFCQRRTSSPGPNFPRTEEVRTHPVSSVSWQLEVACFPHRRHLKYNNKCVCRVF